MLRKVRDETIVADMPKYDEISSNYAQFNESQNFGLFFFRFFFPFALTCYATCQRQLSLLVK